MLNLIPIKKPKKKRKKVKLNKGNMNITMKKNLKMTTMVKAIMIKRILMGQKNQRQKAKVKKNGNIMVKKVKKKKIKKAKKVIMPKKAKVSTMMNMTKKRVKKKRKRKKPKRRRKRNLMKTIQNCLRLELLNQHKLLLLKVILSLIINKLMRKYLVLAVEIVGQLGQLRINLLKNFSLAKRLFLTVKLRKNAKVVCKKLTY